MISIELVVTRINGLKRGDLERWIANDWVRPERSADSYLFSDIDVARARLIQELCHDLELGERALPVVLSLLDQLYDLRRYLRHQSGRGSDQQI
jgi:chaperone modulatory protein CbpM